MLADQLPHGPPGYAACSARLSAAISKPDLRTRADTCFGFSLYPVRCSDTNYSMAIPSSLLRDRVVVITGASQGIGRGIALGCAQAGARVVVHHLGTEAALHDARTLLQEIEQIANTRQGGDEDAATTAPAPAIEVGGDISDPATADRIVAATLTTYGRIDGLVSNAGICPFYSFLDIPHAAWKKTRSVNLDGAFYVVQAVARQMSQQQNPTGGSIVAVSSISALVGGGQQACVPLVSLQLSFLFLR